MSLEVNKMWIIRNDDYLCHYGVKGMRKGVRKKDYNASRVGMPTQRYATMPSKPQYDADLYGPQNRKVSSSKNTHGSLAGVPSNLGIASRFSKNRTKNSQYVGDGTYRTTSVVNTLNSGVQPVRKLNTQLKRTGAVATEKNRTGSAEVIKKKLKSNRRYIASRAGMPSYVKR